MPPLAGPRSMECWTRNPVNVSRVPSSICTGICTMISRLGSRNIFHRPSSRLSFLAARSDRATCASQGLTSSRYAVAIQPPCTALCWCVDPTGSHSLPQLSVLRLDFLKDGDAGFAPLSKKRQSSLGARAVHHDEIGACAAAVALNLLHYRSPLSLALRAPP